MIKPILTNTQLKDKLISYNFHFELEEFDKLIGLGYYHVFNSFVTQDVRKNGSRKELSDYLNIYEMDLELRTLLFPLIIRIENFFKQRFNEAVTQTLSDASVLSSHYNDVVEYCVAPSKNIEAKKILFETANTKNPIVNHFLSNHNDIPIWAYMELLNLGKFINFINVCLDSNQIPIGVPKVKELFSDLSDFKQKNGSNFSSNIQANYILDSLRYIKSIRNNIAHNQPIIDNRFSKMENFKTPTLKKTIKDLSDKINPNINFNFDRIDFKSITDAVLLIYVIYIHSIGKDEYSNRCLNFVVENIELNRLNLHNKLHSGMFGNNYLKKVELFKELSE